MLQVEFLVAGCPYAKYLRVLKYGLGLFYSSKQTFSHTICKLSPSVTVICAQENEKAILEVEIMKKEKKLKEV